MSNDIEKGYVCKCCGQFIKSYVRKLNYSMAAVLILMSKHSKEFFHVEDWLKSIKKPQLRADYHKLRFWGLIEAKSGVREDGSKRNGYYKITEAGVSFAEGKTKAMQSVVVLNNKPQGFRGEEITIRQALGEKFNYDELMGTTPIHKKEKTVKLPTNQTPLSL